MPFKLVSWNVNSLRGRLPVVLRYLEEHAPDVVCLQETRCAPALIRRDLFLRLGYTLEAVGGGGRSGVATLSKHPIHEVSRDIEASPQFMGRRLLVRVGDIWIDNVYVPTRVVIGKPAFLDRLREDHQARFSGTDSVALCGDFNVCLDERDFASSSMIANSEAFGLRVEDIAFRRLVDFGLHDCFRKHHPRDVSFTWFPMTSWAVRRNYGMRLDYVFASSSLHERCTSAVHDLAPRLWPRPSDHLPVVVGFSGDARSA
jgi:exodeoxyribonuclease-3